MFGATFPGGGGGDAAQVVFSTILLTDHIGVSTSGFTGTIATLPGGAVITYNPVSGNENTLNPSATTYAAKQRLYNTTRGNYALIISNNAATNTTTFLSNVPSNWQVGDTVTTLSPVVVGGGFNWVDFEIVSGEYLNKNTVIMGWAATDTGGAGAIFRQHPYETYNGAKVWPLRTQSAQRIDDAVPYSINSNVITISWVPTGVGTMTIQLKQVLVFG